MIIHSATFVKSAAKPADYPPDDLPEIAFAGRSNVGKSSLINALVRRRNLVRTSSTPGRTQLVNFFSINELFHLVDLPGYGYAKVAKTVRQGLTPMIRTYLEQRPSLKAVVLLLDLRRVPSGDDLKMLDWLEECGCPTIPVITKADKVGRSQRERHLKAILQATGLPRDAFTCCSAVTREGFDDLWERIDLALHPEEP